MPKLSRTTSLFLNVALAAAIAPFAHAQSLATAPLRAVATYEAVGLYLSQPGAGTAGCDVRYRVSGTSAWSNGYPLWFDSASNECRATARAQPHAVNPRPAYAFAID